MIVDFFFQCSIDKLRKDTNNYAIIVYFHLDNELETSSYDFREPTMFLKLHLFLKQIQCYHQYLITKKTNESVIVQNKKTTLCSNPL
jgi:hypothetical protein